MKKKIIVIFIIICIMLFIYSFINLSKWFLDSKSITKEIENLNTKSQIIEVKDNKKTQIITQKEEIPEANPYWDYIKMNLIDVNFTKLKKINSNVAGWIQINGTNINYPFVLGTDNKYYLNHSFNNSKNNAGWVFMDYRNNKELSSKNNILYAHGRYDQTMFGSLKNILTNGWLNNTKNYIVKLSTERENTLWQVFSVYKIKTTSDYLKVKFNNDKEFSDFANILLKRSHYNFNTSINPNDKILTLSTCYNDEIKVVLHAKLIKKSPK